MLYMNRWDIEEAVYQYGKDSRSYRGLAARFLQAYRDEVDANSDGWAYWKAPVMAAKKMQEIAMGTAEGNQSNYNRALTPIKRFYTVRGNAAGMKFPNV